LHVRIAPCYRLFHEAEVDGFADHLDSDAIPHSSGIYSNTSRQEDDREPVNPPTDPFTSMETPRISHLDIQKTRSGEIGTQEHSQQFSALFCSLVPSIAAGAVALRQAPIALLSANVAPLSTYFLLQLVLAILAKDGVDGCFRQSTRNLQVCYSFRD